MAAMSSCRPIDEVVDLQTLMESALMLGIGNHTIPCLIALSETSRYWQTRVKAALQAAAPAAAQQLLLQTVGSTNRHWVPPEALLKPLLWRANNSSIAEGEAAVECFATNLAIKVVSRPDTTWAQARVWLSSGLQLSDAAIYAAARSPLANIRMWVKCHNGMGIFHPCRIGGVLPSPLLQALCFGDPSKVRFVVKMLAEKRVASV
jgi:hypothetical protein